jgi:hypothetical protein
VATRKPNLLGHRASAFSWEKVKPRICGRYDRWLQSTTSGWRKGNAAMAHEFGALSAMQQYVRRQPQSGETTAMNRMSQSIEGLDASSQRGTASVAERAVHRT